MSAPPPNAPEITNARVFAAPRERLFEAVSDPKQLAQWWGPNGFTNTFGAFDFRPGGEWQVTMHAPNGAQYPNDLVFGDIVKLERIVVEHLRPMHHFWITMTFEPAEGGTRLTWRSQYATDEGEKMRQFLLGANEENFDRLAAHLANSGATGA